MAATSEKLDQIKELLGSGLVPEVVAEAVGVTASYVSQLMDNDSFRDEVTILRTKSLTADTQRDRKIDAIEDSLVDSMERALPYMTKARDILNAFRVVNQAKRRGLPRQTGNTVNNTIVQINLPVRKVREFVTTQNGEVVEVDGHTMVTMSSTQLLKQLQGREQVGTDGNTTRYKETARYLPNAATNED